MYVEITVSRSDLEDLVGLAVSVAISTASDVNAGNQPDPAEWAQEARELLEAAAKVAVGRKPLEYAADFEGAEKAVEQACEAVREAA